MKLWVGGSIPLIGFKNNPAIRLLIGLGLVFFFPVKSSAQHIPDSYKAGVVERSIESSEFKSMDMGKAFVSGMMEETLRNLEAQNIALDYIESAPKIEAKASVSEFTFRNNTVIKTEQLSNLLKDYIGRSLSFEELKGACEAINSAYARKGYPFARAYLQPQDISGGVVTIDIIEPKLGVVTIEGQEYYTAEFIRRYLEPVYDGPLSEKKLLKALLILNDFPDLKVAAVMEKGTQPYTVDMRLKVQDKNPFHFSQEYNNIGSRYVSKNRIGSGIGYSGIFVPGDKVDLKYVMGMPADNMQFVTTKYSIPIDNSGSRIGFSYTWSDFELQREFRSLDAAGKSNIYGLFFTHPVRRSILSNLDFIFGADYKQIRNYFFKSVASDDELRVAKLGLSGDCIDSLKGRNYFSLTGEWGIPGVLNGLKKRDDPRASRAGAGGDFSKAELQLARVQKFLLGSYILLRGNSQVASDVLPVPEEIAIGGADTVRGYPQSEFLGDHGYNATAELRVPLRFLPGFKMLYIDRPLNQMIQLLGFIDHGKIMRRNALAGERKEDEITGAGVGAVFNFNDNVDFRVEVGWPIGNRDPSDGSDSQTYMYGRIWF